MRHIILTISLFIYSLGAFAQNDDRGELQRTVSNLNQALIVKDTNTIKALLHPQVSYGHSNGWLETERTIVENLYNDRLSYSKILDTAPLMIDVQGNTAVVRATTDVVFQLNGKTMKLKLHVLQVWTKESGAWQLIARQSTKVD